MKIYTGIAGGKKLDKIREYGLGIMISSSPTRKPTKDIKEFSCALDNGAFSCYRKGYPFMEKCFLDTLDICYHCGISLDFIVCPDIVAGGEESLAMSIEWATGRLKSSPKLALVVQNGMTPKLVDSYVLSLFTHLFVGGTVDWKWETAHQWLALAKTNNKQLHIGQVGQYHYLRTAEHMGVDSVDSTSFVVNDSWHILDQFKNNLFTQDTVDRFRKIGNKHNSSIHKG